MTLWKKLKIGCATLILFFIAGIAIFIYALPDMCGNEILTEIPSPNKQMKAVIFKRDCGATTSYSTHVSILPIDEVFENEAGNTFTADTNHDVAPSGQNGSIEVRLGWLSDTYIQIQHHSAARIFQRESKVEGISVEYSTF